MECRRLRHRVIEAAEVSIQAASVWKDLPAPLSDEMLMLLKLNGQVQLLSVDIYIRHIEAAHRGHKEISNLTALNDKYQALTLYNGKKILIEVDGISGEIKEKRAGGDKSLPR